MSGPFGSSQWMYASGADFYSHSIDQSLRFEDGDNPYLSKTFSSSGGTIFTFSCWVKFSNSTNSKVLLQGYSNGTNYTQIPIYSAGTTGQVGMYSTVGGSVKLFAYTTGHFVDPTAWYNVVVKFNGTSGSEEFKVYINGENQDITTSTALTAHQSFIGKNNAHYIGNNFNQSSDMDGYMAEVNFIDGTALDADSFGETKAGIWIPKDTSGLTFGTNGFRLKFQDSSALGDDTSGNGNDFTASGVASTDVVLDSPTNNWCTYNSTLKTSMVLSEGNLAATNSASAWHTTSGTFYVSSGKWYWEVRNSGGVYQFIGIVADSFDDYTDHVGETSDSYGYYNYSTDSSARKYNNNTSTSYGDKWVAGDIIGVALDLDAGTLTFYKNNTSQGTAFTSISGTYAPAESQWTSSAVANFGQDSSFAGAETAQGNTDGNGKGDFYYSPPSGYLALCSANLPDPAIDPNEDEEPADYFNTVLYTGDDASSNAITGVGFQPDWLWIKSRSTADGHIVYDSVRGVSAGYLVPDGNYAEENSYTLLNSLDSDGFNVSHDGGDNTNESGTTYVAWNWLAGGSASSNTDGTITSSVSANTEAGFSIVGYTGTGSAGTVGHGLSKAPELVIWKDRDTAVNWLVQGDVMGAAASGYIMLLNTTGSSYANSNFNTTLGASTITLDAGGTNYNGSGKDTIAYCFHSVDGYSKVGTYTGNGSTNGTFVFTNFRVAWVMIKRTDSSGNWRIFDNKRVGYNVVDDSMQANSTSAEDTNSSYNSVDFVSNGFKLRGNAGGDTNDSGATYIYLCFAEQPFKYSNAR